jgi:pimeloyl-ACP methyl ester carboxylesterase
VAGHLTTPIDDSGRGLPLVLIHGLGLDRFLWDPFIPALSKHYRVIRYDLLGHGEVAPLAAPVTRDDFNAQLLSVLDACEIDQAVLMGFSLGGVIARTVAASHTDRVAGLILLNTISIRPPGIKKQVVGRADLLDSGQTEGLSEQAIERWFTPDFRQRCPEVIEAVLDRLARNNPNSYRHAYRYFAESDTEAAATHRLIDKPTLVITGEEDQNSTPAMAREIADEIEGATWETLPNLRHMGLVEDPAAILALVGPFLAEF